MKQIKTKRIIYILSLILILTLCVLIITGCNRDSANQGDLPDNPVNPLIITTPTAGNILVGECTSTSKLAGEFSVEGDLHFTGTEYTLYYPGSAECEWEFVPDDLESYNKLTGTVTVNVYNYKVTFAENGGFEIEDVFFNDSYTLEEKILTAKNNHRFDGWSKTDNSTEYIEYPITFNKTETLYAGYRLHSQGLYYRIYSTNDDGVISMAAEAFWDNFDIWGNNVSPVYYDNGVSSPVEGSIEGEVIIADMYDDKPVVMISEFAGSKITSMVFSNYVEYIGSWAFYNCYSLTEFTIPNTIHTIPASAFRGCRNLETVIIEDGESELEIGTKAFTGCGITEITLNRVKDIVYSSFEGCYALQSVTIPECVEKIEQFAFLSNLNLSEVIIEGNNLRYIGGMAFAACRSLKEITLPPVTRISADAFRSSSLENIDITDEQIQDIARQLHEAYIGPADDFEVKITRDEQYADLNFEGAYLANTEVIELKFDKFSINVLDALVHEFFHHYQYVLTYGVGEETFNTVPMCVSKYHYSLLIGGNMPVIIVAREPKKGEIRDWEYWVNLWEGDNLYVLVDQEFIETNWKQEYIPLLPDGSNWDEYWNQQFERDARAFAGCFTGVNYN